VDRLTGHVGERAGPSLTGPTRPSDDREAAEGGCRGFQYSASAVRGRLSARQQDPYWIVCVGAPYGTHDHAGAESVLADFRPGREAMLGNLGGQFALAFFDTSEQTLVLATDRFASVPSTTRSPPAASALARISGG